MAAILLAVSGSAATVGPVAAECPFNPAWPAITEAMPTAREVVVGRVVTEFDAAQLELITDEVTPRTKALEVGEVLRGGRKVGDLIDVQYMFSGFPVLRAGDGSLVANCTYFPARDGEVVALALDAYMPARRTEADGELPATRYRALGIIESTGEHFGDEFVSLDQVRSLAALPATDAAQPEAFPLLAVVFVSTIVTAGVLVAVRRWDARTLVR